MHNNEFRAWRDMHRSGKALPLSTRLGGLTWLPLVAGLIQITGSPMIAAATQSPTEADVRTLVAFQSRPVGARTPYRAWRRLTAGGVGKSAWLEATTSFDATSGFTYVITGEAGSGIVRSKVLHPALRKEAEATAGDPTRTAFTATNYDISIAGRTDDGLLKLRLKPRRKDQMLVDGVIVVTPGEARPVRVEGRLSKTPSFWTTRVDIIRQYDVIQGTHLVTRIDSRADLRFFGSSFFCMEIQYESIAGAPVLTARRPWTSCTRSR